VKYTLKKSLGQHFLKDDNICQKIVKAVLSEKPAYLLEIGPGGGAITRYFLEKAHEFQFVAFDIDQEKIEYLQHAYPSHKHVFLLQDILKATPPFKEEFIIVGNFPYNISSQILFKALEWRRHVPVIIGMFQKEVADRVAAKAGSRTYGIISVLVQAFYEVDLLFHVEPGSFNPPPKVRSSVIRLRRKNETPNMTSAEDLFLVVKTAFQQRRKMLRNGLKSLMPAEILEADFFQKRPEQLSVADFAALTFKMSKNLQNGIRYEK
jgi:16S rRNA (adenine1518-N6/adenine1519-N6)-dimethyltransferase